MKPDLVVRGDNYQCGFGIGKAYGPIIAERLALYADVPALSEDKKRLIEARFPQYVAEIQGFADGSGADYDRLLALNFQDVVRHGCSTVVKFADGRPTVGHNEDYPAERMRAEMGKLIRFDMPTGSFTAYVYLGELAGNAYGWNDAGLYFFVNSIDVPKPPAERVAGFAPLYALLRRMHELESLDDVLSYLRGTPLVDGVQITLLQGKEVFSVEKVNDKTSVMKVEGDYFHTNHLVHPDMAGLDEPDESSAARYKKIGELMSRGLKVEDILNNEEGHPHAVHGGPLDEITTFSSIVV